MPENQKVIASSKHLPNNLICAVQGLSNDGNWPDCNKPLVSDGVNWYCPDGHIQYYDDNHHAQRAIPDKRRNKSTCLDRRY